LDLSYFVWELGNEGLTKWIRLILLFLTSNSSLSFEASNLKFCIQTGSSLEKMHHLDFSYFCLGAEKGGFYKANKPDRTRAIMLFLTSNISSTRQNIKKPVCKFCSINMRIIPANFKLFSFKIVGGDRGDRQTFFTKIKPY